MFKFLKRKKIKTEKIQDTAGKYAPAPGTQIHFAPDLIGKLEGDHQSLLGLYGEIKNAFESGKYVLLTDKLKEFKRELIDHLLTENVRLYIYLSHSFAEDEINAQLVKGFRDEMNQIAKVVMTFLNKYESIHIDESLANSFSTDLGAIGGALVSRIEREENTLYPLYMPHY